MFDTNNLSDDNQAQLEKRGEAEVKLAAVGGAVTSWWGWGGEEDN